MIQGGVTVEGNKFKLSEMNEEEKEAFRKEHGEHFKLCVKPVKRKR